MMILILIAAAALIAALCFYYNRIFRRIISLKTDTPKKSTKIILWILSVLFGIASFNLFSVIGIILLHFAVLSLVFDAVNFAVKAARKTDTPVWTKLYKSSILPIVCAVAVFAYGYVNIRDVRRTEYSMVTTKDIAKDYKVLFVSDSHYGTIFASDKLAELKEKFDAENADIVILGGDVVDESTAPEQMREIFKVLGSVKSRYGVYFVYGNHDAQRYSRHAGYTADELERAIKSGGITILRDEYTYINDDIILAGRDDLNAGRIPISELLSGTESGRFILTADHQPVEYDAERAAGTDLIVSGHTHAGQVFPGGLMIRLLRTADLCYGFTSIDGMSAMVSSGVAGWGYPIRTEKHSEYVIINIRKG